MFGIVILVVVVEFCSMGNLFFVGGVLIVMIVFELGFVLGLDVVVVFCVYFEENVF